MCRCVPCSILNISPLNPARCTFKSGHVYYTVISKEAEDFIHLLCEKKIIFSWEKRTVPGRGYGILPSYSTQRWSGPSLWAYGPLNTALMSAMLYTHTAEPRKMELTEKWKQETRLKLREENERPQVVLMMVWWILDLPGGGEDCIHYRVFVISGRE